MSGALVAVGVLLLIVSLICFVAIAAGVYVAVVREAFHKRNFAGLAILPLPLIPLVGFLLIAAGGVTGRQP